MAATEALNEPCSFCLTWPNCAKRAPFNGRSLVAGQPGGLFRIIVAAQLNGGAHSYYHPRRRGQVKIVAGVGVRWSK